jgi:diguanylate cyclase (GGDEF)-like protein
MPIFQSLGARFTAAFITTAAVVFTIFVGLILFQMNRGLTSQADKLGQLSEEKLAERLDAQAKLARARVRNLFNESAKTVESIATRPDTVAALQSRNVVAIAKSIDAVTKKSNIDSIIAIDENHHVIGANQYRDDLIEINRIIKEIPGYNNIIKNMNDNDRNNIIGFRILTKSTKSINSIIKTNNDNYIAEITSYPYFNDFGDVNGALISFRKLKNEEPTILEFSELSGVGVIIQSDNKTLLSVGTNGTVLYPKASESSPLLNSHDGNYKIRCADYEAIAQVCAAVPSSELSIMRAELVRIGVSEGLELVASLVAIAIISLLLIAIIAWLISRQVTRPLVQITHAVTSVARGDCTTTVLGADRRDEVGDIARAVLVLQNSMEERDHLKQDTLRQNDELRRREDDLQHQNLWFNAALNNMSQGLCMFDADQRLIVSNQQYQSLYDLPDDVMKPGTFLADILERSDTLASRLRLASDGQHVDETRIPDGPSNLLQELPDGRVISVARRQMSDGGWVATYEDISERQRNEARIAHLASHDPLTNLPNRTFFHAQIEQALVRQQRYGGDFALHFLDLDNFKTINDTLGHLTGDMLLCSVADRLQSSIRESDILVRLGGDEFAIIQMGLTRPRAAADMAQRLIDNIQKPYSLNGHIAIIGVSIGLAIAPRDGSEAEILLKNADLALHRAKHEGRNTFRFFESEMDEAMRARRALEMDLRQALSRGEFEPYYQPLIKLATNQIIGFEALLRWHHPTRGMVSPGEFIPIAEEIGIIAQIGEWVLRRACLEAKRWPEYCKVAVNISAAQIKNRNLTQVVISALAASGLQASRLEIEVTESVVLEEDKEILATLWQLKELGVRFSMDDFGTGYSSLSCLSSFPFDKIKIDQSFVREMEIRTDCAAIVRAVNGLAQTLNMTTTAEGVETQGQLDLLRLEGCTEVQGYFLGRPMPASAAGALVGCDEHQLNLPTSAHNEPGSVVISNAISAGQTRKSGRASSARSAYKSVPDEQQNSTIVSTDEPHAKRQLRARRMRQSPQR